MHSKAGEPYDVLHKIPAMTPREVHDALTEYGMAWTGAGVAVECGAWLGATCAALCMGLERAGYKKPMWLFDGWKANSEEVRKASEQGQYIHIGQNLEPICRTNVGRVSTIPLICRRGAIQVARWWGQPIEIFVLDAAKSSPAFDRTLNTFGPSWIPGVTVVGLLDFYYARKIGREPNQERWIAEHADSFTLLRKFSNCSCAFFRYDGGVW